YTGRKIIYYYLGEPSEDYKETFASYQRLGFLLKVTKDILLQNFQIEFSEFLEILNDYEVPPEFKDALNVDNFLKNVSFLYNHLLNYDEHREDDDPVFLETPVGQKIIDELKHSDKKVVENIKRPNARRPAQQRSARDADVSKNFKTKATTTPLMLSLFSESLFSQQIKGNRDAGIKENNKSKSLGIGTFDYKTLAERCTFTRRTYKLCDPIFDDEKFEYFSTAEYSDKNKICKDDFIISSIIKFHDPTEWKEKAGMDDSESYPKTKFVRHSYDTETGKIFYNFNNERPEKPNFCVNCSNKVSDTKYKLKSSEVNGKESSLERVTISGVEYSIGDDIFCRNDCFGHDFLIEKDIDRTIPSIKDENKDPKLYPELYRKKKSLRNNGNSSASNVKAPFRIGRIEKIYFSHKSETWKFQIRKYYRSLDADRSVDDKDSRRLFIAKNETSIIDRADVISQCCVYFREKNQIDDHSLDDYLMASAFHFLCEESFDAKSQSFEECRSIKSSRLLTIKSYEISSPFTLKPLKSPLSTMDLFAGCGGLSLGLHQSGLTESKWAVEFVQTAADAYRLNFPNTTLYVDDCNKILDALI
uniref:DNA (cytosine-5-)-methyltransferase n=1 Tax=Romanomermis culicivorax TaxID=13658 RepID=A0A915L8S1_ROMCU